MYAENSAIIGSIEIVDCVQNHPSIWAEKCAYNWVLRNPVLFKYPVLNMKGKLNFWETGYDEIICPKCGTPLLHNRNSMLGDYCYTCKLRV
jgi:hypothetical protein